jgi:hypothetical protein
LEANSDLDWGMELVCVEGRAVWASVAGAVLLRERGLKALSKRSEDALTASDSDVDSISGRASQEAESVFNFASNSNSISGGGGGGVSIGGAGGRASTTSDNTSSLDYENVRVLLYNKIMYIFIRFFTFC